MNSVGKVKARRIIRTIIDLTTLFFVMFFTIKLFFGGISWSEEYIALIKPFLLAFMLTYGAALVVDTVGHDLSSMRKIIWAVTFGAWIFISAMLATMSSDYDNPTWILAYFLFYPYIFLPFLGLSSLFMAKGWYDYFEDRRIAKSSK